MSDIKPQNSKRNEALHLFIAAIACVCLILFAILMISGVPKITPLESLLEDSLQTALSEKEEQKSVIQVQEFKGFIVSSHTILNSSGSVEPSYYITIQSDTYTRHIFQVSQYDYLGFVSGDNVLVSNPTELSNNNNNRYIWEVKNTANITYTIH